MNPFDYVNDILNAKKNRNHWENKENTQPDKKVKE